MAGAAKKNNYVRRYFTMCGRFNLTATPGQIMDAFSLSAVPDIRPNYNITPGSDILAIVPVPEQISVVKDNDYAQAVFLFWGLIPSWAKDRKISSNLINGRAETVADKPSFRSAFKQRRALVVVSGYYEWTQTDQGKQAYHITRADQQVFAFAGLWEHWEQGSESVYSCTIITTAANKKMASVHHRMPVILGREHYRQWLDARTDQGMLFHLLSNDGAYNDMETFPVSNWVNNPRHNDVDCTKPVSLA